MKIQVIILGVVIVLMLFLYSCKINSTQQTPQDIPAQSGEVPLINFNAIEYFDVPTHLEYHHKMKKGVPFKRNIPNYLKDRVPEYVLKLSNSCNAYYYDLSCENNDTLCISPLKPSLLGFLFIQCPEVSTIINVNYEFYDDYYGDKALYKMSFETDSLDLIHLTQQMFLPAKTDKKTSDSDSLVGTSIQHIKILHDRIFIIPSFTWDAGLEVRPVTNEDLKNDIINLPDLGTISYYEGKEIRTPGTTEYFDIETHLQSFINWYDSEHKSCFKDNIAYELGQRTPKYEIVLSDSIKAYYYPNVYSECLVPFDKWNQSSNPISNLGFLVVKTPSFSSILNIEYINSYDAELSEMYFSFDSLGTIYLTEQQRHIHYDQEGRYHEEMQSPTTHIIKVMTDSILYEKYDIYEK